MKGVSASAYVLNAGPEYRPYVLNNKIYPGTPDAEQVPKVLPIQDKSDISCCQAEDEAKRQVTLQKRICLVICTVLPLLTTAATLLRLWQVGVFSSETNVSLNEEGGGCPPGWEASHSSLCFSSSSLSPSNWSTAFSFCSNLGARLPSPSSLPSLLAHYTPPLWLEFPQNSSTTSSSSSCPHLSSSGSTMRPCKDLIPSVCLLD